MAADTKPEKTQSRSLSATRWRYLGEIACLLGLVSFSLSGQAALATLTVNVAGRGQALTQGSPGAMTRLPMGMLSASANVSSEATGDTALPPAAPSVVWLIVMPAVPIVGGAFIYLSRRLLGQPDGECRLVTHVPPPPSVYSEASAPEETDARQDP